MSIAFCFWRCYAKGRRRIHLCISAFCLFLLYQRICRKGLIKMSLLEIDGLTHSFGENVLYKNAGFTLNKGEHIGIVGQNGTGKSTLIKICTEQIIPDSGRVIWQPNITIGYSPRSSRCSCPPKHGLHERWSASGYGLSTACPDTGRTDTLHQSPSATWHRRTPPGTGSCCP